MTADQTPSSVELSPHERQAFTVIYAMPQRISDLAQFLGIPWWRARDLLEALEDYHYAQMDMTPKGKFYRPADWVLQMRSA